MEYYDPIERGKGVERDVTRNGPDGIERKYSGFRAAKYYGGVATADTIGCNLDCKFCWAKDNIINYHSKTEIKYYSPHTLARILVHEAIANNCKCIRISQGEPTLSKAHLISLLQEFDKINWERKYPILIETNGLLLGYNDEIIRLLSGFKRLHVRISLKGANARKFSLLTNAKEEFYTYQLKAIKNCLDYQVDFHPAIIIDFIETKEEYYDLQTSLRAIEPNLLNKLEFERLILYDEVQKRLDADKINYWLE